MKTLTCAAILATIATCATGQFAYVPDNVPGSGGGNNWPLNFSSTTGRFQQMLDKQYLPSQPVRITEVAFSRSSTSPTTFQATADFQLRMSHTNAGCTPGAYASNLAPAPTPLISTTTGHTYSAPTANAWSDLGTVQDFGYDGVRNICLEIRYRGQVTGQGFACHSASIPRVWSNTSGDNFTAATGSPSCTGGLKTRLTYTTKDVLIAPDTVKVGTSMPIQMFGLTPGSYYRLGASFGMKPLRLGNCTVFLTPDNLFKGSVVVGPPVFMNYVNMIPASGKAVAMLAMPAVPLLAGLRIYHAAFTTSVAGFDGCTNTAGTMIIP